DCDNCDNCEQQNGIEAVVRKISYVGELDDKQKARFLEIADKCPVHKTLHNNVAVVSKLVE
ncbi:MAG: putative OsmC-like protein, partial [Granulosicoccus sp.]